MFAKKQSTKMYGKNKMSHTKRMLSIQIDTKKPWIVGKLTRVSDNGRVKSKWVHPLVSWAIELILKTLSHLVHPLVSWAIELILKALRQHQIVLICKPYDTEFFHYARLVYGVRLLDAL